MFENIFNLWIQCDAISSKSLLNPAKTRVRVVPHLSNIFGLIRAGFIFLAKNDIWTTFSGGFVWVRVVSGVFWWVRVGSEPNRVDSLVVSGSSAGFGWFLLLVSTCIHDYNYMFLNSIFPQTPMSGSELRPRRRRLLPGKLLWTAVSYPPPSSWTSISQTASVAVWLRWRVFWRSGKGMRIPRE